MYAEWVSSFFCTNQVYDIDFRRIGMQNLVKYKTTRNVSLRRELQADESLTGVCCYVGKLCFSLIGRIEVIKRVTVDNDYHVHVTTIIVASDN